MKIIIFFLIIIGHSCCAQLQRLIIVDCDNFNSIPYCSVFSFLNNQMQYSDEHGYLYVQKGKKDTLFLRHTGYQDTLLSSNSINDTIKLQRKIVRLREVSVRSFSKDYQIGNFLYKKMNRLHHWTSDEFLRRIDLIENGKTYKVNSIFIPMGFNKKYKDSCNCIVHLYRLNTNKELEDVLTNSVVLNFENLKKDFFIDIKDQNIYLDDTLLYVGLDCFLTVPFQVLSNYYSYDIERHKKYSKHMKTAPIWFYFDMDKAKFDKENGLSMQRNKNQLRYKNHIPKWMPTLFTAGIIINTY